MAVPENGGVKVDSSGQNLENNNNTATSAVETKPSWLDDQSPKPDSSLDSYHRPISIFTLTFFTLFSWHITDQFLFDSLYLVSR
ncbi:hypothetical protein Bca4012_058890 [Brassica carinata]